MSEVCSLIENNQPIVGRGLAPAKTVNTNTDAIFYCGMAGASPRPTVRITDDWMAGASPRPTVRIIDYWVVGVSPHHTGG